MAFGRVNPNHRLEDQGIKGLGNVYYNYLEPDLTRSSLDRQEGRLGVGGALLVTTGKFTGRSPRDKHIVDTPDVRDHIWWDNNARMSSEGFNALCNDMLAHMKGRDVFVQDLYAGADPELSLNIRVVTELAWHNLFVRHLLRRPECCTLDGFFSDYTVINCPSFEACPEKHDC